MRRNYRHLVRRWLPAAGVVVIASVPTFLVATTPDPDALVSAPTTVRITFGRDGDVLAGAGLARGCAGRTVTGVAVAGTFRRPVVVSAGTAACPLDQVRLDATVATIVPVVRTGG